MVTTINKHDDTTENNFCVLFSQTRTLNIMKVNLIINRETRKQEREKQNLIDNAIPILTKREETNGNV